MNEVLIRKRQRYEKGRANDNGSGWGDVEKPLDMLLEET